MKTKNKFSMKTKNKFSKLNKLEVGKQLTQEQDLMQELFSGRNSVLFGSEDSESLPQMNGALFSGMGLTNADYERRTGKLFGI